MRRYIDTGQLTDVSLAVEQLLAELVSPSLAPHVHADQNTLRSRCCYTETVTRRLEAHLASCRALFDFYSTLRKEDSRRVERSLISIEEFVALCEDVLPGYHAYAPQTMPYTRGPYLHLIPQLLTDSALVCVVRMPRFFRPRCFRYAAKLSERDLCRLFLFSRMRVVDVIRGKRRSKFRMLGFEDFMEAFVRLALHSPMPTAKTLSSYAEIVFPSRDAEKTPAMRRKPTAVEFLDYMLAPDQSEEFADYVDGNCASSEVPTIDLLARDPNPSLTADRCESLACWIHKVVRGKAGQPLTLAQVERFGKSIGRRERSR